MKFLSLTEVLEIHRDQTSRYGGTAGIRDIELLTSALGIPMATYGGEFLHTDVYEMATAYLFHLVKNHPFLDGNKRVGVVAALVFLLLNGHDLDAPEDDLAEMVLSVARSEIDKAEVAVFIRRWSTAL
ncbi:type II toxin-antitoxin system death-on-curing family toxin [Desulfofustis glycolicus]|uniref:Death on curing protein n=1 Tax=Desulfofustis glycolicus DSM 9705 TaxID=1121409 RepID=A0A1M5YQR4_9BACT|nr:type II toxin-antitoxin system death-on-curing family toxin [Desulfofustis glycolicus]MCB2217770.1 type II toxin-antitoxin system death-on-curing family toxin [Desulfobulbaceae bacterium]SHI14200.1 death on curing protein [Desulfofustis glycolicus DSM 9705]